MVCCKPICHWYNHIFYYCETMVPSKSLNESHLPILCSSMQSFFPRLSFYVNTWYGNYQPVICELSIFFCAEKSPCSHVESHCKWTKARGTYTFCTYLPPGRSLERSNFSLPWKLYFSECRECVFVHHTNIYQW